MIAQAGRVGLKLVFPARRVAIRGHMRHQIWWRISVASKSDTLAANAGTLPCRDHECAIFGAIMNDPFTVDDAVDAIKGHPRTGIKSVLKIPKLEDSPVQLDDQPS